ncbi:YicC/YloC family endoribonuclease [Nibricoccus sp. IMCC34717]|uniref:YicC/YloC family endoribonuclease n=1 Tax=Nibricoccus sp. IMCC34717 TaxID=3034021 RepID=UPI00384F7E14
MRSMTGFGRAAGLAGELSFSAQVSSVNRKGLDLAIVLPEDWTELETAIAEAVRRQAARGKITLRVEVETGAGAATGWDEPAITQAVEALRRLSRSLGTPFSLTPELLWQVATSQRRSRSLPDVESVRSQILDTVERALVAFSEMRVREGAALEEDFRQRLALIRAAVASIAERAPLVAPAWREQLLKRLRDAGLELNVADERVLKEVALFADRCDIAEELTRLRSHCEQFEAMLGATGECGRKAEFLLQEIGREVNTIGSKANDLTISRQVIELKNELERIREQVANVE